MSEELLKTAAEEAQSRFAVFRWPEPVFGATSVTYLEPRARTALGRKPVPLVVSESSLDRSVDKFTKS